MINEASHRRTIYYSDLAIKIRSLHLRPQDTQFHDLLCLISIEEHAKERGMLSAVVVRKGEEEIPGRGFFNLAKSLGYDMKNRREFWKTERDKVYEKNAADN